MAGVPSLSGTASWPAVGVEFKMEEEGYNSVSIKSNSER